MEGLTNFIDSLQLSNLPSIRLVDILELIILSYLIYQVLRWVKNTRAWVPVSWCWACLSCWPIC